MWAHRQRERERVKQADLSEELSHARHSASCVINMRCCGTQQSLTQHLSPILSSSRYRALLWSPPVACECDKKKCLVAPSGSATSTIAFEACWGLLLLWLLES